MKLMVEIVDDIRTDDILRSIKSVNGVRYVVDATEYSMVDQIREQIVETEKRIIERIDVVERNL